MPLTTCPGCLALEALVLRLDRRVGELERRLHDAERRVRELAGELDKGGAAGHPPGRPPVRPYRLTLIAGHGQNGPPNQLSGPGV